MSMDVEFIKPDIGASIRVAPEALTDDAVVQRCLELLEERGVLVFPKIGLTDAQQLAFTDKLGGRVNFTTTVSGGDAETQDVYTISLDPKRNPEPEYVLGTFFWHMDGVTSDIVPPKATVLSCRKTSPTGGQTQFASTYRAYEALPEEEKKAYENLRVMHSVTAAVREVAAPEDLEPRKRGF